MSAGSDEQLTSQQIQELFDVDATTVARWVRKGCPSTKSGTNRFFNSGAVAQWMKDNKITGKPGRPQEPVGEEIKAAKLRKEIAIATKYELEVAQTKGELVEKAQVERANIQKITLIKNRLLGLGAKLGAQLDGMNAAERQGIIDDEINLILSEFARG